MSKTVWITGASSGIGREFARRYARLGFRLILTARRTDRLEALAAELTAKHSTFCRILPADLEQESECARLCEALTDEAHRYFHQQRRLRRLRQLSLRPAARKSSPWRRSMCWPCTSCSSSP